jgi:CRP/FNR family transcriptional regulator, cyclic AMP receptor protein
MIYSQLTITTPVQGQRWQTVSHPSAASDSQSGIHRRQIRPPGKETAVTVSPTAVRNLTSRITFWDLLIPADRARFRAAGTVHHHPSSTVLLREGDPSASVLVLLAGRVKVVTTSPRGYRCILAVRGPGDLIGELAAIDTHPRMATVIAVDPVSLLRIPIPEFDRMLDTQPRIAHAVLKVVAGRLRSDNRRQTEFTDITAAQRLDIFLAELAAQHGAAYQNGVAITLPFSQEEIAGSIGASREAVVRALRILRREQIVSTRRQMIVVLRPDALRDRADDAHIHHPQTPVPHVPPL